MSYKTYIPEGQPAPSSQVGATLEALAHTIATRVNAKEGSYTHRLLTEDAGFLLSKVTEEAGEVAEAAEAVEAGNANEVDHLRYEAADVVYHLMVVLERYGIPLEEFAAELNMRMTDEERPEGGVCLMSDYIKRGK